MDVEQRPQRWNAQLSGGDGGQKGGGPRREKKAWMLLCRKGKWGQMILKEGMSKDMKLCSQTVCPQTTCSKLSVKERQVMGLDR